MFEIVFEGVQKDSGKINRTEFRRDRRHAGCIGLGSDGQE